MCVCEYILHIFVRVYIHIHIDVLAVLVSIPSFLWW